MSAGAAIAIVEREGISETLLGGYDGNRFRPATLQQLDSAVIPPRGAVIGYWRTDSGAFFPEFLIIRDDDMSDTLAWLSSFLNAFTPISQWCRIWTQVQFRALLTPLGGAALPRNLGAWVGAVIAECSAQSGSGVSLREISGTAALTSASFSAARALSVWGTFAQFSELAHRHDELSGRVREGHRPINAAQMLPLWYAIAGGSWEGREPPEARSLQLFTRVFDHIANFGPAAADRVSEVVTSVTDEFDLPELSACAVGPQQQRVDALDRLAERLLNGPKSPAIEGILGFGASLIDVGAAALPELLKRYTSSMPMASMWAGAFAGAWSPRRVLSDFSGLGRIISKELLRPTDLFSAPTADISFEELSRWLGPSANGKLPVRGMIARTLNVELLPGVSAAFPLGRTEPARSEGTTSNRQRALDLDTPKRNDRQASSYPVSMQDLARKVEDLLLRVAELEGTPGRAVAGGTKGAGRSTKRKT